MSCDESWSSSKPKPQHVLSIQIPFPAHPALWGASPCPVQCRRDGGRVTAVWSPDPQVCCHSPARKRALPPAAPGPWRLLWWWSRPADGPVKSDRVREQQVMRKCGKWEKVKMDKAKYKLQTSLAGLFTDYRLDRILKTQRAEACTCILDSSYSFLVGGGPWPVGDEGLGRVGWDDAAVLGGAPPPN